ncbi:hypothetical protein JCM24511_04952 [Saitozyma sp. JCM 24511]|nr:hypothetical protein JCM24511_04952 [Saitozyma sp. JCM 24511]
MSFLMPTPGANHIRTVHELPTMILEKNVDIPLKDGQGLVRANIYKPKAEGRFPVIMTYGPYGKDIRYEDFHGPSYAELPEDQKSDNSAWETPHPEYWTSQGYIVARVDERGLGSSYGFLDTMSDQTSSDFAEVIEWAAVQPWSTGRIGLLGISYYGGSQWRVAARRPKGLACIIPWEGMTDYYRDRVRHGGIYSNKFVSFWWNNQVGIMQYGRETKSPRRFGPECIEGTVSEAELVSKRHDQVSDNSQHRYLDEAYHQSRIYNLSDINVPVLSVANLGGILLHLRGNVNGYLEAGTPNKWLYFISGRHDLPFYLPHYVRLQRSFLDAWLKDEDRDGWKEGPNNSIAAVNLLVRKGNPGFNSTAAEATFKSRSEAEWPLARTEYKPYYLTKDGKLQSGKPSGEHVFELEALGRSSPLTFEVTFNEEIEIAGHSTANLVYSLAKRSDGTAPRDIDVFVTLRHFGPDGKEIFYTGTAGDPVPLTKGWLRGSLRAVNGSSPRHREWLPYREYRSTDVDYLQPGQRYELLVEIWPTACVVEAGGKIVFEVATGDTQGSGIFLHNDPIDRNEHDLGGLNLLHVGGANDSWVKLPIV